MSSYDLLARHASAVYSVHRSIEKTTVLSFHQRLKNTELDNLQELPRTRTKILKSSKDYTFLKIRQKFKKVAADDLM